VGKVPPELVIAEGGEIRVREHLQMVRGPAVIRLLPQLVPERGLLLRGEAEVVAHQLPHVGLVVGVKLRARPAPFGGRLWGGPTASMAHRA
jgi:hypothetical protein